MTGEQGAIDYLVQAAKEAINGQTKYGAGGQIIADVGSIRSPLVKPVLETALASKEVGVARAAAVNLLFRAVQRK